MHSQDGRRLAALAAGVAVFCAGGMLPGPLAEVDSSRQPVSICSADFDEDGVRDIVIGYSQAGAGGLVLLRGNVDSIHPNSVEARRRVAEGRDANSPFLPPVPLSETHAAPELLVSGDFDNDGHKDVVYAERSSDHLTLVPGNGRGGVRHVRRIAAPGRIRSISAGEFGRRDGQVEILVEEDVPEGVRTFLFEDTLGAALAVPRLLADSSRASASSAPATELRMRLNADAIDDVVRLRPDALEPSVRLSSPRATFMVSNTNDSGTGSLRAAIDAANGSAGDDQILFSIPGAGPHTIALATALPAISPDGGAVTIDATSEPDYNGSPAVVLDGSGVAAGESGIVLIAANCAVRGLAIGGFRGDSNVGGGHAISILAGGNCRIEANYLGTNAAGTAAEPNTTGVSIQISAGNVIGGTVGSARNVISGNESVGVAVNYDETATENVISGNYIGTNASGTSAIPNGTGVYLSDAPNNVIGGLDAGAGNVISGSANPGFGVGIAYERANGNLVQGNIIGLAADGLTELGNDSVGVFVSGGASNNVVGGPAAGGANVIAYNLDGVQILQETSLPGISRGNLVTRNSVFANDRLGINLSFDYDGDPAANDDGDADSGPNDFQNYPVITSASNGRIRGTLESCPNTGYTIDFYQNDECDQPSGFGEGRTWIGAAMVTTDGSGRAEIDASITVAPGTGVAATATDDENNTSEFSQCFAVGGSSIADLAVSVGAEVGSVAAGRTLNYYLTVRNFGPGTASDVTLTDQLPSQTTFVDVTAVAGWSVSVPDAGSGGSLVAATNAIPAGAEATFVITLRVRDNAASGDIVNTASITSAMDPSAANNSSTEVTRLNGSDATADLSVSIVADPDPVQPASRLVYAIQVANAGPSDATDTLLTAEFPEGTAFQFAVPAPASAPAVGESGTVAWDLGSFTVGRTEPFFAVVSLPGGVVPPPQIVATASVTNSTTDPDTSDNVASAATMTGGPTAAADLSVSASASAGSVQAGDSITYSLGVTNNGPDPATGVAMFATLPSGAYFVSASSSQGTLVTPPVFDSGAALAMVGTLASGASATVTVAMTVTAGGGSLVVQPFAVASTTDPNGANDSASLSTTVRSAGTATITWDPPDLESPELEPPPRNLTALLDPQARTFERGQRPSPPGHASPRRADPPLYYNIYTSNVPGVAASEATFFASVPGSQTTVTAPVAPGGSFFVVTAGYPTGESAPTNEDGAGEVAGPAVTSVVATAKKITIKGSAYSAPMQVFVDGIPFATPAKVKASKVNQKGRLLTGQALGDYARAGQTVVVTLRAANGGTTTVPVTRR